MVRAAVAVGDVFAFKAAGSWVPCQVIGAGPMGWETVVFEALSDEKPTVAIIDGAPLYVLRRTKPRNQPLFLDCEGQPPAAFQHLGNRPVRLAFPLPETSEWVRWAYAIDRVKLDLAAQPAPFRSKLFPGWKTVDPRALRAIDAAVTRFAAVTPATEGALRKCVVATNKHEGEIQTIEAEELFAKLVAIAVRNKLPGERASVVIEDAREW